MKGIIYKIVIDDKVYVGSTKSRLSQRQSQHNYQLRKGCNRQLYNHAREKGIEEIICVGLETFKYNELWELRKREEELRLQEQNSLNEKRCYVSEDQKKTDQKIWKQRYYEGNKERIHDQNKRYYEDNKQKISEQRKIYLEKNKEKIYEYQKKYREQNKEKISERNKRYYEKKKAIQNQA